MKLNQIFKLKVSAGTLNLNLVLQAQIEVPASTTNYQSGTSKLEHNFLFQIIPKT
jgi:hypothetical protein